MNVEEFVREFQNNHPTLVAISGGTVIGLMVAYAKARERGMIPGRRWWIQRLLLVSFFGVTAGVIKESSNVTPLMACFITAVLNMMGFAAVELIERRAEKAIAAKEDAGPTP